MKLFILVLSFAIPFSAIAQDSLVQKVDLGKKKFLIGVNFSPDYCYRSLVNSEGNSNGNNISEFRNDTESPKLTFNFGAKILYKISSNIAFETGLQYSNQGFAIRARDLYFGDQIDPRNGFEYDTNKFIKYRYNYTYLDFPIRIIFTCGEKNIRFSSSLGVTTSLPIKATGTYVYEDNDGDIYKKTTDLQGNFNKTNFFPTISAGIDYQLSQSFSFKAEPTFRYGLIKIQENFASTHLWNCGLNLSCYYTL